MQIMCLLFLHVYDIFTSYCRTIQTKLSITCHVSNYLCQNTESSKQTDDYKHLSHLICTEIPFGM